MTRRALDIGKQSAADQNRAALLMWDAGDPLAAVTLGGIGPGYEQAIWVLVVELVRRAEKRPVSRARLDALAQSLDQRHKLGCSGAQVGVAVNFAASVLLRGWFAAVNLYPSDRTIFVSTHWPRIPAGAK